MKRYLTKAVWPLAFNARSGQHNAGADVHLVRLHAVPSLRTHAFKTRERTTGFGAFGIA